LLSPCPNKYNVAARNTILILFLAAEDDKNVGIKNTSYTYLIK
jgi:hypothetical protein